MGDMDSIKIITQKAENNKIVDYTTKLVGNYATWDIISKHIIFVENESIKNIFYRVNFGYFGGKKLKKIFKNGYIGKKNGLGEKRRAIEKKNAKKGLVIKNSLAINQREKH